MAKKAGAFICFGGPLGEKLELSRTDERQARTVTAAYPRYRLRTVSGPFWGPGLGAGRLDGNSHLPAPSPRLHNACHPTSRLPAPRSLMRACCSLPALPSCGLPSSHLPAPSSRTPDLECVALPARRPACLVASQPTYYYHLITDHQLLTTYYPPSTSYLLPHTYYQLRCLEILGMCAACERSAVSNVPSTI